MDKKIFQKAMNAVVTGSLLLLVFSPAIITAVQSEVRFSFDNLSEWSEKSFKGHTSYTSIQEDGRPVLQAIAVKTASALYKKSSVNATEMPIIEWSWKVKQALPVDNRYRKDVDDFAGRVMVIFPGTFFWQYRAIVYVWSDKLPIGTVRPSAFGKNIAVIVVESGNQHAGIWRNEQRNYLEDYRSFFHASPPNTMGVAVMTDADNTISEAAAWYGDIVLTRELEQISKEKQSLK
jgi:Protein of unknown function (DUF3047)